jgi:hypothetical protein
MSLQLLECPLSNERLTLRNFSNAWLVLIGDKIFPVIGLDYQRLYKGLYCPTNNVNRFCYFPLGVLPAQLQNILYMVFGFISQNDENLTMTFDNPYVGKFVPDGFKLPNCFNSFLEVLRDPNGAFSDYMKEERRKVCSSGSTVDAPAFYSLIVEDDDERMELVDLSKITSASDYDGDNVGAVFFEQGALSQAGMYKSADQTIVWEKSCYDDEIQYANIKSYLHVEKIYVRKFDNNVMGFGVSFRDPVSCLILAVFKGFRAKYDESILLGDSNKLLTVTVAFDRHEGHCLHGSSPYSAVNFS